MRPPILAPLLLGSLGILLGMSPFQIATAAPPALFQQNFDQVPPGPLPEDFLVLDGAFTVKDENGQRFVELPGTPLETFGVLFGPAAPDGLAVQARIFGTNQKRRFPAFGVGLNGVGGFRLILAAAKRQVELYQADQPVASAPFEWTPESWSRFHLQISQSAPGQWTVQGKVWPDGQPEPKDWMISHVIDKAPYPGKASFWGKPYSGTPIRFDDLVVSPVSTQP